MIDPITPRAALALLGVSMTTLRTYARNGVLNAYRLPSGHRRYSRAEVESLCRPQTTVRLKPAVIDRAAERRAEKARESLRARGLM